MLDIDSWVVVGLDNGGTANNATIVDASGHFLVGRMVETPSRVKEGPEVAVAALQEAYEGVLSMYGIDPDRVRGVGFDTPGPASADGIISSRGSTNFAHSGWNMFDFRGALEDALGIPVIYSNDANAAALYAHHQHFGALAGSRSSAAAIVGTGLGGGVIEDGKVIKGAAGMAGELGHVHIPLDGLLEEGQSVPECNCGFKGDAESVASLTGIRKNLLPYWLTRYPDHQLASMDIADAAKQVRSFAEAGDEMARAVFAQQAMALGRLFTILANVTDPHAFFVGGGVVETSTEFREWFLGKVRENTYLRDEQMVAVQFEVVPDLDMAGARGAALAALEAIA